MCCKQRPTYLCKFSSVQIYCLRSVRLVDCFYADVLQIRSDCFLWFRPVPVLLPDFRFGGRHYSCIKYDETLTQAAPFLKFSSSAKKPRSTPAAAAIFIFITLEPRSSRLLAERYILGKPRPLRDWSADKKVLYVFGIANAYSEHS